MITLGIETSCDETACAVVHNSVILSNIVSSSVPLHEKYGGVIPEIASRFHVEYINRVAKKALKKAKKRLSDVKLIAVTDAPGLPGSLVVGRSFAKALGYALNVPVIKVDHLSAHLYANFLVKTPPAEEFPFIGVVVSGGHTNIFIYHSFKDFETIGKTKDDAVGEAFDKVAKILGIGYPGGPKIEKYARKPLAGEPIKFPKAYLAEDSFDFSMSGIKTAVLYYVRDRKGAKRDIARISRSFQESVFDILVERVVKARRQFNIKKVLLGGGVVANKRLRDKLKKASFKFSFGLFYPPPALCLDNAAMVAGLGEKLFKLKKEVLVWR